MQISLRKTLLNKGNMHKGSEAKECLLCPRNRKEAWCRYQHKVRDRIVEDKVRGPRDQEPHGQ